MIDDRRSAIPSMRLARELWMFVGHRRERVAVRHDDTASLDHVVEALVVSLTEVEPLRPGPTSAGPGRTSS